MSEVAALPWNGYNVVSTFAGCGGSSTGYRMAGFRVLLASEFVEAARDTYAANMRPGTILDGRDIRDVTAEDILARIGMKPGELDVLDGSPPCASFSTAGKREKAWGKVKKYSDTEQRADDLFFEFARLVKGIQPKVFVAENVSGLVKGTAKGYFLEILAALKACGYKVSARLLDAQWLGVPQARQRLIFVGVRDDLGIEPAHPSPFPYRYSIRDALPWIVAQGDSGSFGKGRMRLSDVPSGTLGASPHSGNGKFPPSLVEAETDISRFAIGQKWDEIGLGGHVFYGTGLSRPHPDGPCPTLTASGGGQ
jgi:DNA (cytosine-5)-methyltransferase 1